jgi:hypothetical protein
MKKKDCGNVNHLGHSMIIIKKESICYSSDSYIVVDTLCFLCLWGDSFHSITNSKRKLFLAVNTLGSAPSLFKPCLQLDISRLSP